LTASRLVSISWLLVFVCALGAAAAAAAQKPVRQSQIHGDGGFEPPETIDQLWEQSAVVIDGRVVDVRPANQTFTPGNSSSLPWWAAGRQDPVTMVRTDYVIQVQRVLKSDDVVRPDTATVIVRRLGGTVDRGEYIEEQIDSFIPKFNRQGRYALFLKLSKGKQPSAPVYFLAVGADSAFEIVGDRVVPLGRTAASRQLGRLSVEQFVATLAKRARQ
jgi:hypothetical protein